jgi:hypothetical protein
MVRSMGGAGGGGPSTLGLPMANLADGDSVEIVRRIASDETLAVLGAGTQTDATNVPSGLEAVVYDLTNAADIVRVNDKDAAGDPLGEVSGPVDVAFRVSNNTGGSQNASGAFEFEVS